MKSTIFRESEVMEIEEITEDYVLFKGIVKKNYPDLEYTRFKKHIGDIGKDDQRFLKDCKELGIGGLAVLTMTLKVKGKIDVKD